MPGATTAARGSRPASSGRCEFSSLSYRSSLILKAALLQGSTRRRRLMPVLFRKSTYLNKPTKGRFGRFRGGFSGFGARFQGLRALIDPTWIS